MIFIYRSNDQGYFSIERNRIGVGTKEREKVNLEVDGANGDVLEQLHLENVQLRTDD